MCIHMGVCVCMCEGEKVGREGEKRREEKLRYRWKFDKKKKSQAGEKGEMTY